MTDLDRLTTALSDRYSIEGELGAGGMATVYLAQDVKHDRKVAVKVLRPELAAVIGAERFLTEIKTTANLQHPHILALHDSGEADSFLYYVMPYIDGESLRDRLDREKQLPVDDAVRLASQVASALDYAHRHGVIHRDIKPENILLQDDAALVADFGIALAASKAGGTRMTETGMSLGTPTYMSPEQAMGDRELTARSDVYALGATLYEMLTGEPPFGGPTAQAIVAKVMTDDPRPPTELRRSVPLAVNGAVIKALEKLPADRFGTASEFAAALSDPSMSMSSAAIALPGASAADWRQRMAVPLLVAVAILVALVGWALSRSSTSDLPVMRFALGFDDNEALFYSGLGNFPRVDVLPDGAGLVYVGVDSALMTLADRSSSASSGGWKLWHRSFDQLSASPIPGTEGGWAPAVSPNGTQVAFLTAGANPQIKVISLAGGPPLVVSEGLSTGDLAWGPDGWLYFLDETGLILQRVSAGGGDVEQVVTLRAAPGVTFGHPLLLPNGRGIIAAARQTGEFTELPDRITDLTTNATFELHFLDLESGESLGSVTGVDARYATSGHLVYLTAAGTIMAAPFDQGKLALSGQPKALVSGVSVRANGWNDLSLSANGTLVYTTLGFNAPEAVVWVTRAGQVRKVDEDWTREFEFEGLAVSPSGELLAVEVTTEENKSDIWIKQLDTGPLSRLTFSAFNNRNPVWAPDGESVTFISERERDGIWNKRADGSGSEELVIELDRVLIAAEWSGDGGWLVISAGTPGSDDILAFRPGVDSVPTPLVASQFNEFEPALSPDGRFLAYVSDESGQREVYLRPFPNTDNGKWLISGGGGIEPAWSADGRELFYRSLTGQDIHVVDLTRGPSSVLRTTTVELPRDKDYEVNSRNRLVDVAPDGRFLMIERAGGGDISGDLIMVQNFFRELEEKVGN
jgi:Tol biopolymer transport system component